MSIVGELDKALRRAGIPIDGCAIARFDAVGQLAEATRQADAWHAVALALDFGESAISPDDPKRVLTSKDAEEVKGRLAEIEREIARLEPMIVEPETRPWDKTRWRVDFKDEATDEHRQAAAKILTDFDPDAVKEPVPRSWAVALGRLTMDEARALKKARNDHIEVDVFYDRAMAQPGSMIDLNDEDTQTAFALVERLGVFTRARLDELFAPAA